MARPLKRGGVMIFHPENFAEAEHWVGAKARNLEQRFVTHPIANPFVFRDGSKVKPGNCWRKRLTLRIDRHDRLCKAGDGNAFDGFWMVQLRDSGPDRSTGRFPKGAGFEIRPVRPWMRPRGRFGYLGDDDSCAIESETFEVSGPHIESKDQVMVKHRAWVCGYRENAS